MSGFTAFYPTCNFSLGRETTEAEIDAVIEKLKRNLKG